VNPADGGAWLAAFMAGLLGSGHCFAMCGGIASGLGLLGTAGGKTKATLGAIEFNLGRLFSYCLMGAVTGGMVGVASQLARVQALGQALRLATAVMIALLGVRFLFNWRGLDMVEHMGVKLWNKVYPWAARAGHRQDRVGRWFLGTCWGLLPCGLVYTMLLTAASTGRVIGGATTMLAFGLGTLPSMLGLTLAAPGLTWLLGDRSFRGFVGFSLIVLALWMVFTLVFTGPSEMHAAH
jgi:sulfite exporter TauE/SafE